MSAEIEFSREKAAGVMPTPHTFFAAEMLVSARRDAALMEALAAADDMAMLSLLQSEWSFHLGEHPDFAEQVEAADPHICNLDTLAELIALAPTSLIRQVLREAAYCREQMASALGLAAPAADARARLVLAGANAEWEILQSAHPEYSFWLNDRFTCTRSMLIDGMLFAPTDTIRHVLRETFCFREIAAMVSDHQYL